MTFSDNNNNNNKNNNNTTKPLLAVVEGGGTAFTVAVCEWEGPHQTPTVVARQDISSDGDPHTTLRRCAAFFREHQSANGYAALGIATFGPVGVRADDTERYGRILSSSPKAAWRNVDLLTPLRQACSGNNDDDDKPLPVLVETDVNAPALAEYYYCSSRRDVNPATTSRNNNSSSSSSSSTMITSTAYITVGTGVGVGLVVNGKPVHGRMHPEGGHIPVQPLPHDAFAGYSWGKDKSPFQGIHTVEGIASTVALTERVLLQDAGPHTTVGGGGGSGDNANTAQNRSILADLPDHHPAFEHAVNALANLCATLLLMLSMERIVLGGGLMNRASLLPKIQARTAQLLNGYLPLPRTTTATSIGGGDEDLTSIITLSQHGKDAGLNGAIVLAQHAYQQSLEMNDNDDEDPSIATTTKRLKQEAFATGLWHGMIVGAVAVAAMFQFVRGTFFRKRL
eukprot:CAMPEP_0168741742 /NCGR_PEP_ID=MMETSP0724-20121128/12678_1 /TAXON_ID=265536 /ORGANISM="Amphiprora sp., Strain CCMP467" /LENGTH=452 /DNA_ID=CAMNT_0008789271 /DNA_START=38 /DNA_END=1396 /DNA_ORIENTATION=+